MWSEDRVTPAGQAALDAATRRYALGALDDAESLEVEERLVTDPAAYDVLLSVADDLIEDHLDGALSVEDRQRFETHFLAIPEHRDRLEVVRALRAKAAAAAPPRLSARTRGLATAAVIAVAVSGAVGSWLARAPRPRIASTVESAPAESVAPQPPVTPGPGSDPSSPAPTGPPTLAGGPVAAPPGLPDIPGPADTPAFPLRAGLTRSGGALPRVAVPAGAASIRLRLETSDRPAAGTYRATIEDVEGAEVFTALIQRSAAGAPPLSVTVPADRLGRGDYRLVLTTADAGGTPRTIATYPFRVTAAPPAPPR